jgi:hypothetical protein
MNSTIIPVDSPVAVVPVHDRSRRAADRLTSLRAAVESERRTGTPREHVIGQLEAVRTGLRASGREALMASIRR